MDVLAGAGKCPVRAANSNGMNANEKKMKVLADALEILAGVLRDVASSSIPASPEAAAAGLPDEGMKYARAATLAKRYDYANEQGIIPILKRGVEEKAIRKLGGPGPNGERGPVAVFRVEDVDAYMEKTRGGRKA